MYQKYFVYIDDGTDVYKVAVAAVSEDAARAYCAHNGEIIAVKDVTEQHQINLEEIKQVLQDSGRFGRFEVDFISRALQELGIAD